MSRTRSWRMTNAQKRTYNKGTVTHRSPSIGLLISVQKVRNNFIVSYRSWNAWRNKC